MKPQSITKPIPLIVRLVSAIFVATITLRVFLGVFNTFNCSFIGNEPYSGKIHRFFKERDFLYDFKSFALSIKADTT